MLAFERTMWARDAAKVSAKEESIRRRFGMSPMRYYQRLNQVIRQPEALEADPVTVSRLLRVADERHAGEVD